MQTLIGAIALVLAAPVAAQTVPATDPHPGHAQHQPQQPSDAPSGHKMGCKCCDEASKAAEQKDCCAENAGGKAAGHDGHDAH